MELRMMERAKINRRENWLSLKHWSMKGSIKKKRTRKKAMRGRKKKKKKLYRAFC